jgi:hypothetical protein
VSPEQSAAYNAHANLRARGRRKRDPERVRALERAKARPKNRTETGKGFLLHEGREALRRKNKLGAANTDGAFSW